MPPQTGSFGANLGGISALKEAMTRRGVDASVLDQISGSAPAGPSNVAPTLPTSTPDMPLPPAEAVAGPVPAPAATPLPMASGEMEIALKALAGVVKSESKIKEAVLLRTGVTI